MGQSLKDPQQDTAQGKCSYRHPVTLHPSWICQRLHLQVVPQGCARAWLKSIKKARKLIINSFKEMSFKMGLEAVHGGGWGEVLREGVLSRWAKNKECLSSIGWSVMFGNGEGGFDQGVQCSSWLVWGQEGWNVGGERHGGLCHVCETEWWVW